MSHFSSRDDLLISMVKSEDGFGPFFASKVLQEVTRYSILSHSQIDDSQSLFFIELTEKLEEVADLYLFRATQTKLHESLSSLLELLDGYHSQHFPQQSEEEKKEIQEEIIKNMWKELAYWKRIYFARWEDVRKLINVNRQRKQKYNSLDFISSNEKKKETINKLKAIGDSHSFDSKIKKAKFVIVHFYAIYSRLSRELHSFLSSLSDSFDLFYEDFKNNNNNENNNNNNNDNVNNNENSKDNNNENNNNNDNKEDGKEVRKLFKFYEIDGVKYHSLSKQNSIKKLPALKLFINGIDKGDYPVDKDFVKYQLLFSFFDKLKNGEINDVEEFKKEINVAVMRNNPWKAAAKALTIAHIKTSLNPVRKVASTIKISKKLKGKITNQNRLDKFPPTFYIMGGGMGAGKSTVMERYIHSTDLYKLFGDNFVVIAADEFKEDDPIYTSLSKYSDNASQEVHAFSQSAAEALMAMAIQQRKDIVWDGTASWAPFVKQTIEMVRDNFNKYTRGPGYQTLPDGTISEHYWQPLPEEKEKEEMAKYQIELIGVYVDPATAVERGIIRELETGRGVPLAGQLNSFKLFAQNFEEYVHLVDKVILFNNNLEEPLVVAQKDSLQSHLLIHPSSFDGFLNHRKINVRAKCAGEIFFEEFGCDIDADPTLLSLSLGALLFSYKLDPLSS